MKKFENIYGDQFKFEHKDINNLEHLPELDIILNICAESHVDNSIENGNEFLQSNIIGVYHLLEIIKNKKKRPLFYQMSTDEIYGDILSGSHNETDNYNPSNTYSFTKASADLLIKSYSRTYGVEYKMGRATNTWGIRQNVEKLIPKTCRSLQFDKKIELHNNGTPKRMWLHVNDCVNGILTIIEKGNKNEIYNISGEYEQSNIITTSKIINCYLERDINTTLTNDEIEKYISFNYNRPGVDLRYSLDDTKLRNLGWKPIKEFDKELPNIVKYYRENFIW
jgi:dTDP-glucose 4,6-dehydratase